MAIGARVIDKDRGLTKILANMRDFDDAQIAVGFQGAEGGAIHPDGDIDIVGIAVIHEFGAPGAGIPERSLIRATFDAKINDWVRIAEKIAESVYSTTPETPGRALGILGEVVVSDYRKAITAGIPPPLRAATIARKGSSTPWLDTGVTRNAITWTVRA